MLTRLQFCSASSNSFELDESFFYRQIEAPSSANSSKVPSVFSFDTLFGAFAVQPWLRHTYVRRLGIRFPDRNGDAVAIFLTDEDGQVREIESKFDRDQAVYWCEISEDWKGILYPQIRSSGEIPAVDYVTDSPPIRSVRLAVIIPTFKREAQVTRNARAIALAAKAYPEFSAQIFVVDNGGTLSGDDFGDLGNISLIRNRNTGGSGGFARGMLEACGVVDKFTHIVMCDDDADVEPHGLFRSGAFFSFCNEKVYLGGTMLMQHDRAIVHESGARVTGPFSFQSNKHDLNALRSDNVAKLCREEPIDYFGWYLVGFPIAAVQERGLPQPFFIRFDDQEFGLRLLGRGYKPATLLGFCVWHEGFHLRDSHLTYYYLARNGIITMLLHRPQYSGAQYARQIAKEFLNSLYMLRYDRAAFILDGAADALRGPEFIANVDEEALNASLLSHRTAKIGVCSSTSLDGQQFQVRPVKSYSLRRLLAKISFGGHLLPSLFVREKTFLYLNTVDPVEAVFSRQIFFYEPINGIGWIAHRDVGRCFALFMRGIGVILRLRFGAESVGRTFREQESRMTSVDLWKRRLRLPDETRVS